MAASASDKLRKSYSFLQKSLNGNITDSDTTITLNNTTSIPTDTAVDFIIDRVDSNGNRTNSTREIISGVVSGSTIINCTRGLHGTTAQSHTSGAVVEFVASGPAWNDLIDHLRVEHNQDGTHGAVTATSVATDTITEDTAAAGVTIDGLLIKDSKLATNDSVVTANITDAAVTNAKLSTTAGQIGGVWQAFTPSPTGYSGTPTVNVARYMQVGKTVWLDVDITGTSNAATLGLTLPVAPKNSARIAHIRVQDNGTYATTPGVLVMTASSTTASVGKNISAGGGWTSSGTKTIEAYGLTYEAA